MKYVLTVFIFLFSLSLAKAQPYKYGVGARVALFPGVSVKLFSDNSKGRSSADLAYEGIAYYQYGGGGLIALAELQYPLGVHHFWWYFGGGIHAGYYSGTEYYNDLVTNYNNYNSNSYYQGTVISPGLSGIVGIEIKMGKLPITFGADFRPHLDFAYGDKLLIGGPGFMDAGASLRYIFK